MSARLIALLAALPLAACVAPQPPAPSASAAVVAAARTLAPPASEWTTECEDWDDWDKRAPAFQVYGDTYHVGTCGISAILIAGPEGHVLIDSGTANGSRIVLSNIRQLGFQPDNLRGILTSHEHYDHVGGLLYVHQNSGARIYTSAEAAPVIETGLASADDPQFSMHPPMRPVAGDLITVISPGMPVEIAGLSLTPIATPGHTPGALSWQWESCDEAGNCRSIVYADSLSAVSSDEYRFSEHPAYVQAYRDGLARLAALDCDILLTPHPSASGMREKLLAGDLTGGMGCAAYAADRLERLDQRLALEAEGQS